MLLNEQALYMAQNSAKLLLKLTCSAAYKTSCDAAHQAVFKLRIKLPSPGLLTKAPHTKLDSI